MTDFTVSITDVESLAGITWAREQKNAQIPLDEGGEPTAPTMATDQEYVQWVMEQASDSYAQQKRDAEWRAAYEAEQETFNARRATRARSE